ncbi:uncharacterized protein [Mytilus edulis]|uniref:uncharacterized protein n=1 Tax=Mytilus edulis TaxID=6550 RepID=UPI0039EF464A
MAGNRQDASYLTNQNSTDPKQQKGTCFLYEDTHGRRHFHDNSHATGATDIENNQYQGPEVPGRIILHHPMADRPHVEHDMPSRQFTGRRRSRDSDTTTMSSTTVQQTPTAFISRPMSPLTINTDLDNYPPSHSLNDETKASSPFYYSHIQGPLKSPGIFVPYTDERKREIIEKAIKEALANDELSRQAEISNTFPLQDPPKSKFKRQMSADSNDSNDNRSQVFPSKRHQDSYSASGIDNIDRYHGIYSTPVPEFSSLPKTSMPAKSLDETYRQSETVNPSVRENLVQFIHEELNTPDMRASQQYTRDCSTDNCRNSTTLRRQSISDTINNPHKITESPRKEKVLAAVPEKPYTKNLQWVVSDPNPNSVNDFVPATPTALYSERSTALYSERSSDPFNNTLRSSTSDNSPGKLLGNSRCDEIDRTLCTNDFSKEFNHDSFHRDALPLRTSSTIVSGSTVTEKGFVFPPSPTITCPLPFSPRIVHEQFTPKFKSTPKDSRETFPNPVIRRTVDSQVYDSPSRSSRNKLPLHSPVKEQWNKLNNKSPSKNIDPLNQLLNQRNNQHSQRYCNQNLHTEYDSERITNSFNSTLSRSTSLSNHTDSFGREKANEYIQNNIQNKIQIQPNSGNCTNSHILKGDVEKELLLDQAVKRLLFRSYSAIELSPSKADIERMRNKVRNMYRSMSSPAEMKEMLKNLLVEERIKEEFFMDNDVFDTSSSPSKLQRHPGLSQCQHGDRNVYRQDDIADARRRLFVDAQLSKDNREQQYATIANADLPHLLEMFKPTVVSEDDHESTDHAQYLMSKSTQSSTRCCQRDIPQTARFANPEKAHSSFRFPAPSSTVDNRFSERDYDRECNMPACSHSQPRYERDPNRKRKHGDVEVCVKCEEDEDEVSDKSRCLQSALKKVQHPDGKTCRCANIESAILEMARDAYKKIRRWDSSEYSFDRFNTEATETREQIFDSVKVLCEIKSMCKYGRIIEDIFSGSIIFLFNCPTLLALDDLWEIYLSGKLKEMFNSAFITDELKHKYRASTARLEVVISQEVYHRARSELLIREIKSPKLNTTLSKSDTEIASVCSSSKENYIRDTSPRKKVKPSALAIIHMRSQSAPSVNQSPSPSPSWISQLSNSPFSKERKFSFSNTGELSPRKVFQEINTGSPTLKKVFDFDVNITSKLSPKRKTFGDLMPWENQNVQQETSTSKRKSIRD